MGTRHETPSEVMGLEHGVKKQFLYRKGKP